MDNFNNDEKKKILDMLKEQAEIATPSAEIEAQATDLSNQSDDDIKAMLKKQFSFEHSEPLAVSDEYSFDIEDLAPTGEIAVEEESAAEQTVATVQKEDEVDNIVEEEEEVKITEEADSSFVQEENAEKIDEIVQEILDEAEEIVEETIEEIVEEAVENVVEEAIEEIVKEAVEEVVEVDETESINEPTMHFDPIADVSEATNIFAPINDEDIRSEDIALPEEKQLENNTPEQIFVQEIVEEQIAIEDQITIKEIESENTEPDKEEEGPLSEESINYDEVLEGQQGTVFNNFVEDFTGDLDDVVFEAEITASHAPAKQYTIFEDWEKLMKDKQYETAEEGIIPPTKEELAYSAEIAARAANGQTDYFTPITPEAELDAVDIALMVALGGESEIDQTVGFEKIRQAVNASDAESGRINTEKSIFGFCGEEYTSILQTGKIKKKYKNDKTKLIVKTVLTAIITVLLACYEMSGWMGNGFGGILDMNAHPIAHVLFGLQLLLIAIAISGNKLKTFFKNMLEFSSISYIGAIILTLLSILHDVLIMTVGYADPGATVHSLAALLLLISLIYDIFDISQQSGVFDIVSRSNKKLVLEPYGKLKMSEDENDGDIIDKDSYCISRVSNVNGFFARISKATKNVTGKLVSLVLSFSVSLCVMLVLLLTGEQIGTVVLSLVVTLSCSLICASIFESEFAFFTVHNILKKYKTGIIGKASVEEYGKCNILYFDDFNVFNKKSVRTKGLKLYDNNEIYRILYHTQAVFSKVGGPLKGVFEFATTEMIHSRNVEIKEISKEGISAVVDNRTSVLIGTGSFMKSRGIHPSYTAQDLRLEEAGEESILFIALGGSLGAKLYVTYQFSGEFEKLAKKLTACGINIGIRSSDPNINDKWAKTYGAAKKCSISVVRPNLKELKAQDKSLEGGIVSIKNVRAISEAAMMCTRLYSFESVIAKIRIAAIVLIAALTFTLVMVSGINAVSMLLLMLACALGASVMMLLSHFYVKR